MRLPLFPLHSVLCPGVALPLHIFEERYRVLVRELLELPEPQRRFGVVAIRQGREVGVDGVGDMAALHDVGCVARLRRVERYDDGRFDLVTTGAERFRLADLLADGTPYLTGTVEWLPDHPGPPEETLLLARAVSAAYQSYLRALATAGGAEVEERDLPTDPLVLSYLVAATVVVDLDDRQRLLAEPDVGSRLRAELTLLRREQTLLRTLTAAPGPELTRRPISLN